MRKHIIAFLLLCLAACHSAALAKAQEAAPITARTILVGNEYVASMAAMGGRLYLLKSDGLYQVRPQGGGEVLLDAAIHASGRLHRLITNNGHLYGLGEENMALYELNVADGHVCKRLVVDTDSLDEAYIKSAFLADGQLVCLIKEDIVQINIQTGAATQISGKDIASVAMYKEGLYTAIEYKWGDGGYRPCLVSLHPQTGERAVLTTLEPEITSLSVLYNPENDTVYLWDNSQIYVWREGAKAKAVASFMRGDTRDMVLLNDDYAAVNVAGKAIAICAIDPSIALERKRLVVQDRFGMGEDHLTYLKTHTDVDLVFSKKTQLRNDEQFIQDMITGRDDIDIYLLENQNLIATIKAKGFYVDLSASPIIAQAVGNMHTPFQTLFAEDGRVVCLPKRIFLPMISYNEAAFEVMGLSPPTTYAEFVDFFLVWMEAFVDEHPEYILDDINEYMDFVSILKRYTDEMNKNGHTLDYESDTLKTVLEKYIALQRLAVSKHRSGITPFFYVMDIPSKGFFEYLPLAFEKDNAFVIEVSENDFSYFVVNPYSKNKEEAIALLECYVTSMDSSYNIVLFQSFQEAVPNKAFEENIRHMSETLQELETRLALADEAEKAGIENLISDHKDYMAYYLEEERWQVTPEHIRVYKAYADNVYFSPLNPIPLLQESEPEFFNAYLTNPQFDLDVFLKELNTKVKRMLLELQ